MAKELSELIGKAWDESHQQGKEVTICSAFDITEHCPSGKAIHVHFAHYKKSYLVRLINCQATKYEILEQIFLVPGSRGRPSLKNVLWLFPQLAGMTHKEFELLLYDLLQKK